MKATMLLTNKKTTPKKSRDKREFVSECLYLTSIPIEQFPDELAVIDFIVDFFAETLGAEHLVGANGDIALISDYPTGKYSFSITLKNCIISEEIEVDI